MLVAHAVFGRRSATRGRVLARGRMQGTERVVVVRAMSFETLQKIIFSVRGRHFEIRKGDR
jgi:hypothetical protein